MTALLKKFFGSLRDRPRQILSLLLPLSLFLAGWWFGLPNEKAGPSSSEKTSDQLWTCSMHPQVRQPNPGLCPICEMDLIPLQKKEGGGLREVSVTPEVAALLDLRVSPVLRTPVTTDLSLFGKISYDERRLSTITSRIGDRLDRLFVDFTGARVRMNDHLAEVYSPEIYVAQRELIEAARAIRNQNRNTPPATRETRERLLSAAREKLRLLQIPKDKIDRIAGQKEPRDQITIESPRDGVVISKFVEEGQYVKTGDKLFQVADLSSVWLELEAYESDLPWLRYAQQVRFTVAAVPGRNFSGRVAWIDPEINPFTRVAKVRLTVKNIGLTLKPGMFARAEVEVKMTGDGLVVDPGLEGKWISPMHPEIIEDEPGKCAICGMDLVPARELGFVADGGDNQSQPPLLIPASAVLQTGKRAIVYLRLPELDKPTFAGREIVLGPKVGSQFVVKSGLREGELVDTKGAFKLDSELQIKARPSMMNPNAGLEEKPAHDGPDALAGQWQPVLRSLARFQEEARSENPAQAREALARMRTAISSVDQTSFLPETVHLWEEFSNRLLNVLTLAGNRVGHDPVGAYGLVARAIEEAGRYLGLSFHPVTVEPTDPELVAALTRLVKVYLPVVKALADDDPAKAQSAALPLAREADKLTLPTFPEEAEFLNQKARALAATSDLEAQRVLFQKISNRLIELIRKHGLDRVGNAYVIHCPMAFDNTGADWISEIPQVLNPYFGDTMLRCGSVTATLSLADLDSVEERKASSKDKHDHDQ